MKKIIMTIIAAATLFVTGCKHTPTVEEMEKTALAVGRAAGYVANQTKIDDKSREVVIEIMTRAAQVVPEVGQTFVDAWTPIAKEVTDKLVEEGKIDQGQAILIGGAFNVACRGLDYLVSVRFPKAKQYENLVAAGVKGFTGGFLEVFKPSNLKATLLEYDEVAFKYLSAEKTK